MAETILIDALAGTLPEGFCPKGPGALQELFEAFIANTQWSLSVGTRFFNYGDTEPTPDMRIWPWLKTVSGYPDRRYDWVAGQWLSLHLIPAGPNGYRADWVGTEDELKVWDDGEIAVTTLTTGPFWEIDHDFDGRSPMGPGAIPNANPAKTLSPGENYGEGAHVQLAAEVGAHTHPIVSQASFSHDGVVDVVNDAASGPDEGLFVGTQGDLTTPLSVGTNDSTGGMPIVHPVRGCYKIKRTIRKYYRGT